MAVIKPTITRPQKGMVLAIWLAVTEADTFGVADLGGYPDKSVHIAGTFGTATVTIQGSNDNTNFIGLNDPQGSAISVTAAALEQILENTRTIKPVAAGGSSQSLNVYMIGFSRG